MRGVVCGMEGSFIVPRHPVLSARIPLIAVILLSAIRLQAAETVKIAFLAAESSPDTMGPHNRAAWETAAKLGNATLLLRQASGHFADTNGTASTLQEYDVAWYHQGDAIARTGMYRGASLAAIRKHAGDGGGVLLSGGALAMVAQLRLETDIRPQRHDLDNYRDPAGMVPVETAHPAFVGLKPERHVTWLSHGGCRAVADFYWGGPGEGMVLAKTPTGSENPLVEYRLGKGRVIVFGWHWPDYADKDNPHRANLARLTSNLLAYLADAGSWQPFAIRSDYPPAAAPRQPGVSVARWRALRMGIDDLAATFDGRYPHSGTYRKRLSALRAEQDALPPDADPASYAAIAKRFEKLQREALLGNPLLDFERLLMIRRRADRLGLLMNAYGNAELKPTGYGNTLVALAPVRPDGKLTTIFAPEADRFIGDLDLHYDADRLLMSTPDANGRWTVAELHLTNGVLTPLPLIEDPDVHNFDACYLPDNRIVFTSTAPFTGVPCVGGKSKVGNLYLCDHGGRIRRLTHDQDHNWCPTVLNSGRILYQRWEYADIAHAFTRLLFHANPDGSGQMEYYGSNSFWPTTLFFTRAIPGHPTRVVTVVGGHHDAPRQGDLVILDPARGRFETEGVVQRIPGHGKAVEPVILDGLVGNRWPRFLHPYPLGANHFIVSCKPTRDALWGVYLVDVFDNFVLLAEEPGYAMLEPVPLRKTPRPPIVPDRFEPGRRDATVFMMDVYHGPGLRGVPRGTVKALRLLSYEFTFHGFGGEPDRVGFDGPWDVKRILGTVPVESDGSAHFRVPACTPVAVQPLDAEGKALALMRSWFTAVPGETLSCVGCHEPQNSAPPAELAPVGAKRKASEITPWYGAPRGFAFTREVQPVLDAYCVACHHGKPLTNGQTAFDLTARPAECVPSAFQMRFTPSYVALRRFVHGHTLESDAHMLPVRAFHADTSKLVQILRDGHYGVRLDREAWDRLITWIDLNAPAHGTWNEVVGHIPAKAPWVARGAARRRELHRRYAGIDEDPEALYPAAVLTNVFPVDIAQALRARAPRAKPGARPPDRPRPTPEGRRVLLADSIGLELVRIGPGDFVMGSDDGYPNERPARPVAVTKDFWIGRLEVSNREYACFDPSHDSGLETGEQYAFGDDERGHLLNRPEQPVVRVSREQAMAFCRWLSEKTGSPFDLPTEVQWEYACRAGTTTSLWYGTLDDDFSDAANLSDATHHTVDYPHVPTALPPWRPADTRFDDGWRVSAPVGTFEPNPWGLHDMHGNVAEWTRSPYGGAAHRGVVRGGSWLDRPRRARAGFRLQYAASQAIHDVGFRVVCEE